MLNTILYFIAILQYTSACLDVYPSSMSLLKSCSQNNCSITQASYDFSTINLTSLTPPLTLTWNTDNINAYKSNSFKTITFEQCFGDSPSIVNITTNPYQSIVFNFEVNDVKITDFCPPTTTPPTTPSLCLNLPDCSSIKTIQTFYAKCGNLTPFKSLQEVQNYCDLQTTTAAPTTTATPTMTANETYCESIFYTNSFEQYYCDYSYNYDTCDFYYNNTMVAKKDVFSQIQDIVNSYKTLDNATKQSIDNMIILQKNGNCPFFPIIFLKTTTSAAPKTTTTITTTTTIKTTATELTLSTMDISMIIVASLITLYVIFIVIFFRIKCSRNNARNLPR